ncbi:MAG: 2-amino-4-hydroxy-6-hydroxymethyldihydropteridine diphosphokinase [Planctomycetota bacterium]
MSAAPYSAGPHFYLISLGANLGDRAANLTRALSILEADPRNDVVTVSQLWETPPHLPADYDRNPDAPAHPPYLNACAVLRSALDPDPFLETLLEAERRMGRVRDPQGPRYQPRPIDLDVIVWDGGPWHSASLELPHPRFEERGFVLLPMREVLAAMPGPVRRLYDMDGLIGGLPGNETASCQPVGSLLR